jgi:hydroxymethylglutaryl-CoA reductase (NADPH)
VQGDCAVALARSDAAAGTVDALGMLPAAALYVIDAVAYGCHSDRLDLRARWQALDIRRSPTPSHQSQRVQRRRESSLVTGEYQRAFASLRSLLDQCSPAELLARFAGRHGSAVHRIPSGSEINDVAIDARWNALPSCHGARGELLDAQTQQQAWRYAANVENFIGTVKVPVGVIGPLRVNGTHARGDYFVPLATTEATLVASYGRGAKLITSVGGCSALSLNEGIARAPGFAFHALPEAAVFAAWLLAQLPQLTAVAAATSRYTRLQEVRVSIEGNHVYLILTFHTGDAAGQNMATIAAQAICEYLNARSPVKPDYYFLEANHSGDKKASAQSALCGRGRSVTADVVIPAVEVQEHLHATPEMMAKFFTMGAIGGVMSGAMGSNVTSRMALQQFTWHVVRTWRPSPNRRLGLRAWR